MKFIGGVLALAALLAVPGASFAVPGEGLEQHGFKKYPLKEGHMKRLRSLKTPSHKFVPVKKGDDQSWLYVDPVSCHCYYYGDQHAMNSYKDRSWGDRVADHEYMSGNAMDWNLYNGPGEGVPIGLQH